MSAEPSLTKGLKDAATNVFFTHPYTRIPSINMKAFTFTLLVITLSLSSAATATTCLPAGAACTEGGTPCCFVTCGVPNPGVSSCIEESGYTSSAYQKYTDLRTPTIIDSSIREEEVEHGDRN